MSQSPRTYEMQALTWREIQELVPANIDTVILPVGTVEAHGASCIGTDNYIPDSIAQVIAPELSALIAPIVNHGITRSLYGYPGSTTISPQVFIDYLLDILRSFARSKFKNVIILNGHGGNTASLKDVVTTGNHQIGLNICCLDWWEMCRELTKEHFGESGGHAGLDENAMVMAINPEFGRKERYTDDLLYSFAPGANVYPIPGTILTYTPDAGRPRFDNLDEAKAFHAKVCAKVCEFSKFVLERWRGAGLA